MVTLPGNGSQGLQGQSPTFPTHICSSKLYPIFHGGARAGNSLLELIASFGLSGCFPTPQQERDNLGRQFLLVYQAISIKEYQQLQSHPAPIPALHHQFAPCGWWDGMGEAEHLPWILPPNPASMCRNSTARSSEFCLDTSPLILWFSSPPFPSRCFCSGKIISHPKHITACPRPFPGVAIPVPEVFHAPWCPQVDWQGQTPRYFLLGTEELLENLCKPSPALWILGSLP